MNTKQSHRQLQVHLGWVYRKDLKRAKHKHYCTAGRFFTMGATIEVILLMQQKFIKYLLYA